MTQFGLLLRECVTPMSTAKLQDRSCDGFEGMGPR